MLFGDLNQFGIEYFGRAVGLEEANVYVAGKNITPIDNLHYKLAANLKYEADRFKNYSEWLECCNSVSGTTLVERFNYIFEKDIRFKCRVFDWGPPTDDCFFMLIPLENRLHIYGKLDGVENSFGIEIQPPAIIKVLQEAEHHITNQSN